MGSAEVASGGDEYASAEYVELVGGGDEYALVEYAELVVGGDVEYAGGDIA